MFSFRCSSGNNFSSKHKSVPFVSNQQSVASRLSPSKAMEQIINSSVPLWTTTTTMPTTTTKVASAVLTVNSNLGESPMMRATTTTVVAAAAEMANGTVTGAYTTATASNDSLLAISASSNFTAATTAATASIINATNPTMMDFDGINVDGTAGGSLAPLLLMDDCVFRPTMENYVMIFTFSIIFCLSVVGNSIVVVVILQQRSMRSVTNLYLLNLALSDLLLSVVCMPPTLVSSLLYCWVFGDLLCKLLAYLQPVVVTASAYTLAAIALERYYAICKPLESRVWHTRAHACVVISLVWLVSVIANVFMLFMYEERKYNVNGLNCSPKFEPIVHFGYQIYMTLVLLVIPLVTMSVLYANVIRTLRTGIRVDIAAVESLENTNVGKADEHQPNHHQNQKSQQANRQQCQRGGRGGSCKRDRIPSWRLLKNELLRNGLRRLSNVHQPVNASREPTSTTSAEQSLRSTHSGRTALVKQRLIRMLIVIVVIFFCCWTPSYIWWLLLNAQDSFGVSLWTFNIWNSELNTLITVLTYLSSCTNPITYCFLNNKFRNALFLTFGCRSGTGGSDRSRLNCMYQQNSQIGGSTPRHDSCQQQHIVANSDANNNNSNHNHSNEQRQGEAAKAKKDRQNNCCLQMLLNTKRAIQTKNSKSKRSLRRISNNTTSNPQQQQQPCAAGGLKPLLLTRNGGYHNEANELRALKSAQI